MAQDPSSDDGPWERVWHVGVSNTYYLEAIGQIIVIWSRIEADTKMLFWHYAGFGVNGRIGRIVTAGARYGDVVDMTKRIVDKTQDNQVLVDHLDALFTDCARLKTIRDHIAHREWGAGEKSASLTNMTSARDKAALQFKDYTVADLRAIAEEMNSILPRIRGHLSGAQLREAFAKPHPSAPAPWLDKFEPRRTKPPRQ